LLFYSAERWLIQQRQTEVSFGLLMFAVLLCKIGSSTLEKFVKIGHTVVDISH